LRYDGATGFAHDAGRELLQRPAADRELRRPLDGAVTRRLRSEVDHRCRHVDRFLEGHGCGWSRDQCPHNGGIDQNIYGDKSP
jgi:hypothetical protein